MFDHFYARQVLHILNKHRIGAPDNVTTTKLTLGSRE